MKNYKEQTFSVVLRKNVVCVRITCPNRANAISVANLLLRDMGSHILSIIFNGSIVLADIATIEHFSYSECLLFYRIHLTRVCDGLGDVATEFIERRSL